MKRKFLLLISILTTTLFLSGCMSESQKREFKEKYNLDLLGDYSGSELKDIRDYVYDGDPIDLDLRHKMENAGDTQYL